MIRTKIKIEMGNYFGLEQKADFSSFQNKTFEAIAELYASKADPKAMTGWLNLCKDDEMFFKIKSFVEKIRMENKYQHVIVLGIGGSSLGAQAIIDALKSPFWNRMSTAKRKGYFTIDFIDNLDPQIIRNLLSRLKLDQTLFLVISKGGMTAETIIPMLIAKEWTGENFYKQCVFISTEGKGLLYELSQKNSVEFFSIPENVGGRFSAFSPVGLLPAALSGMDMDLIREGISGAYSLCQQQDLRANIAASIALCSYFSYTSGKNIFVLMPYSSCLKRFAEWFVQLWAESLGKNGKGMTPLVSIGATDQHSQLQLFNQGPTDKLICFVKISKHKRDLAIPNYSDEHQGFSAYSKHKVGQILNIELEATRRALTENGKPNFTIVLPELDEYYLSQLMFIFEVATSICGKLLGVNPFDQPGVELSKKYTKEALEGRGYVRA